jgi:Protein of unknown function (DUF2958)
MTGFRESLNYLLTNRRYPYSLCQKGWSMKFLHRRDRERLIEKGRRRHHFAYRSGRGDPPLPLTDPHLLPTVLLYIPNQGGIWLLSDIHPQNHDRAYGLRYLSRGIPEIGYFSLSEITATHRRVRRVRDFRPNKSLLGYASELWTKGLITPQNIRVTKPRTPELSSLH